MGSTRRVCLAVTAIFFTTLPARAQGNPDFTGTWTRMDVSPSPESFHIERIAQAGGQVRVDVEEGGSGGRFGYSFRGDHTYTIGGPLESKKDTEGRVRSVAVSWDGSRLVFLRTTTEGANTTTEREAWSLADDGAMLFKDRRTTDWRGTRDERIVFQRRDGKPGGFQVYGAGTKPCRQWISERSGPAGTANTAWVLGYLTAYGVERSFRVASGGDPVGKLPPTDLQDVERSIGKYCGDRHPDSNLWGAAEDLIRQLGGKRPAPTPPVREYR